MANASRLQVVDAVQSCLTSDKYSDLTIKCRDDVYKVHKVIVCTRAGFFAGAMRFGGQQGAQHDVVDLSKDEPKVIASLVQYLYSGEYGNDFYSVTEIDHAEPLSASQIIIARGEGYSAVHQRSYTYAFPPHLPAVMFINLGGVGCKMGFTCCKARGPPSQLLDHSKMYAITDKYVVTGLKELACKSFRRACGYFWNSDAFATAIDHAFSSTVSKDTDLRSIIIQTISTHMAIVKKPEIQALVLKHGDLAIGILLKKMG
ncbi:hypothetical protein BKA58DRAFT_462356 [Alternaria rosae]|uniref:uncharacterized protein n=1 Tax=Alternaria rosae TaxID=1187941 RepID=UPI001E8D71E3|nr:uncharacterized protein BKA58DRAFT_462356 [Alternaria rosae]KAH6864904.1 hypothetical protein BKA58DRAFT_462356 [Alternaria rosae]